MSNIADDMIDEAHSKEIDKLNITIARLQDQLTTARKALEHAVGTARYAQDQMLSIELKSQEALAAIPLASDCERLLEEARAIIEEVTWAATWNSWQKINRVRDLADKWLAKFTK